MSKFKSLIFNALFVWKYFYAPSKHNVAMFFAWSVYKSYISFIRKIYAHYVEKKFNYINFLMIKGFRKIFNNI